MRAEFISVKTKFNNPDDDSMVVRLDRDILSAILDALRFAAKNNYLGLEITRRYIHALDYMEEIDELYYKYRGKDSES